MGSESESSPLRVVIFPWLAFGHMLPYLELSERLAARGHHVSYVSTPRNLARLPPLRPASAPRIHFVSLPLPHVDGLPQGAESTNDVPDDKRQLHWKAFDGLAAPFAEFLAAACAHEATRPHWVIADSFPYWAAASAEEHKVPCALLLPTAAAIAAVPPPPRQGRQPSAEPPAAASLPRHEREALAPVYTDQGVSSLSTMQRWSLTREKCTLGAIRSCVEWEPESFPQVAGLLGMPVVPLGLLPPPPEGGRRAAGSNGADHPTVRWLDAQPPGSVLYVALGSEVPLPVESVHELALGLELAGTRFLWALRKPSGAAVQDKDGADMLPPGILDRTRDVGLVSTGWVPQMTILAHAAVGGFLTHCGQNSLTEGLMFGHPLVMLPLFWDQGPNARQMEAKNVGLQVPRDDKDGSIDRHGVASTVRAVMHEGEARSGFLAGAAKMQEIVNDNELHERYVDELVQHLRTAGATNGAAPPTSS
uniref:Uncharacterized protein n=1 Tax=Avena sativa TaxID=4498 RepID=A0ACD5WVR0_AVESA